MRWTLCLLIACSRTPDGRPTSPGVTSGTPSGTGVGLVGGTPAGTPAGTTTGGTTASWEPLFTQEVLLQDVSAVQVANLRALELGTGEVEVLESVASPPTLHRIHCTTDCVIDDIPVPPGVVPTRTSAADLDADGDQDIVLASIGQIGPTNELVGALWLLRNEGTSFAPVELLTGLPRTVCAEPGDLDGDGDLDLTLCLFGHVTVGELGWLEQRAGTWRQHTIDPRPGTIHAFPADMDGDGDLDIVAPISQLTEEVMVYWNDGSGGFTPQAIYRAIDTWFGLSGVELADLDRDGDLDVLFTNGDTMDSDLPGGVDPNAYHALHWLRNDGVAGFTHAILHDVWGAYAIRTADLNDDGHTDIVLGTFTNTRTTPGWTQPSEVIVLINDGTEQFTPFPIDGAAPQMLTLELADADADGDLDIFTGSMRVDPDQDHSRLVLLRNASN